MLHLNKKIVTLAIWTGVIAIFPALAPLDVIVRPVITTVVKAESTPCNHSVDTTQVSVHTSALVPSGDYTYDEDGNCEYGEGYGPLGLGQRPFWQRGPVRRFLSGNPIIDSDRPFMQRGPIRRGILRIGWRITHPFGGRFRCN